MKFRGGEFSTGTTGNFQSELTVVPIQLTRQRQPVISVKHARSSGLRGRLLMVGV